MIDFLYNHGYSIPNVRRNGKHNMPLGSSFLESVITSLPFRRKIEDPL
jgi:hypothetical protein